MEFKHDNINHLYLTQILIPYIDLFSRNISVCYDQLSMNLTAIIECFKMYIKIPYYPSFTEIRPLLFCWYCCLIARLIGVAWWYLFSSASKVICMYMYWFDKSLGSYILKIPAYFEISMKSHKENERSSKIFSCVVTKIMG